MTCTDRLIYLQVSLSHYLSLSLNHVIRVSAFSSVKVWITYTKVGFVILSTHQGLDITF